MSEQTPSSPDNLQDNGVSSGEPSMEDILASIRKIISEDEPVAMESPEDVFVDLKSDAEIETVEVDFEDLNTVDDPLAVAETVDAEQTLVDLDVEAVLSDMNLADASEDVKPDENILDMLGMEIPLEADAPEAEIETYTARSEDLAPPMSDKSDTDEMDALLDGILLAPDEDLGDVEETAPQAATVDNDPDLELVKTLMADLSDDQGLGLETDDDLDSLLAIPEIEAEAVQELVESDEPEVAEEIEEDILSDILNMTLDDEIKSHPEDLDIATDLVTPDTVAADELANLEANDIAEQIETAETADELPSLADIAAAAQADAVEAETAAVSAPNPLAATAGLAAAGAGLAALGATALGNEPVSEDAADPQDITPTLSTQTETPEPVPPSKEPSMPVQAVNTDTILDDVTESAAAGAFAELNSVVEEKAVFNERGPRIGDLVQEALRPMLKDWLDANLKGIVERAVAKEVKRISSGK